MRCFKAAYWMADLAGYATAAETCVPRDVEGRCLFAGWALLRRVDALYGRALPKKFLAVTSEGARPRGRTGTARRATPLIPCEKRKWVSTTAMAGRLENVESSPVRFGRHGGRA
jgi:hypothetical protein